MSSVFGRRARPAMLKSVKVENKMIGVKKGTRQEVEAILKKTRVYIGIIYCWPIKAAFLLVVE